MDVVTGPELRTLPERPTLGIRLRTPFRGMLAVRDQLLDELYAWLDRHGVEPEGPSFLRLHVVDMVGEMELEVGVLTTEPRAGDDRVRPGVLPAGDYAALAYRMHDRRANVALLAWVEAQGLQPVRTTHDDGDHFVGRVELCLTDPRTEPRKTRRVMELNLLVAPA